MFYYNIVLSECSRYVVVYQFQETFIIATSILRYE